MYSPPSTTPKRTVFLAVFIFVLFRPSYGQDSLGNTPLTLPAAFSLALHNSVQLQIRHTAVDLAKQQTEIEKLGRLPDLNTGIAYGYLSSSQDWTPNFAHHFVSILPHHLTQFTVDASEAIFAGNRVNNSILKASLEEQVAVLSLNKDEIDIKFLVAAGYLDIFRLIDEQIVYINNTRLARERLRNILNLRKQGIVTQNDVLRTELTISDYELATRDIGRSIIQQDNQLNIVLGLPDSARLIPDSTLTRGELPVGTVESLLDEAYHENHDIKIAGKQKEIAETNIKLLKGERLPTLGVFANNNFQRPYLNSTPAVDVYYNYWTAGVGLSYNISSIYKSPKKIKAGYIGLDLTSKQDSLTRQNVEVGVRNAFVKYNQSLDELQTYRRDLRSAEENYRVVESRYYNQLALLTDLIDATNTKIEAELKVTNAEINRVYSYYALQKTIGTL
jgi:outer membrane protein